MHIGFEPRFTRTSSIKKTLRFIEEVRGTILLPRSIQKTIKKREAHYFQLLEDLSPDKHELYAYLAAYDQVIQWAETSTPITEVRIKKLHGLILGSTRATAYRRGPCGVFNAERTKTLYLPPRAEDVRLLMKNLVDWLSLTKESAPIKAAIAHFGINSIHPYYDGNGRCARLVTKWILHQEGYDLGGLVLLEDYYYKNILRYYKGLTIKNRDTYYSGPQRYPVTSWLEYFLTGMAYSYRSAIRTHHIKKRMTTQAASGDRAQIIVA